MGKPQTCADVVEEAWRAFDEWLSANAERLEGMDIVEKANLFLEEADHDD